MDLAIVGVILAVLCSIVAILVTCFGVTIEWKSLKRMGDLFKFLEHESEAAYIERSEQGNIGEQMEEWLMEKESDAEDAPTKLQAISHIIGHAFFGSLKASTMQSKSVDARTQNKYDDMVKDGIEQSMPFELKILKKGLERFGIDLDEVFNDGDWVPLQKSLKKYGIEVPSFGAASHNSGGDIPRA